METEKMQIEKVPGWYANKWSTGRLFKNIKSCNTLGPKVSKDR